MNLERSAEIQVRLPVTWLAEASKKTGSLISADRSHHLAPSRAGWFLGGEPSREAGRFDVWGGSPACRTTTGRFILVRLLLVV
jgi:hypothetical protein